jgi:hypothetical protein
MRYLDGFALDKNARNPSDAISKLIYLFKILEYENDKLKENTEKKQETYQEVREKAIEKEKWSFLKK